MFKPKNTLDASHIGSNIPNPQPVSTFSGSYLKDLVRFIASMPVAISMLCLVALTSVIGTILQQQQNYVDYVNRFGLWWTDVFMRLSLHQIYSATWFLGILAFLCTSTSICIIRNWPTLYRQMQLYQMHVKREHLLKQSLSTTFNKASQPYLFTEKGFNQLLLTLQQFGFKHRSAEKTLNPAGAVIAAKKNAWQKWGYLFTHVAILIISVGGLFDGNLPLKWRLWQGENVTFKSNDVVWRNQNIVASDNPSFRANVWVPEGGKNDLGIMQLTDGILAQQLPFSIELKKFHVDYYSTGMPKRFVSDVLLRANAPTDGGMAAAIPNAPAVSTRLEVNKPFTFMGHTLYQASFEDGGSKLSLQPIVWQTTFNAKQLADASMHLVQLSTKDKLPIKLPMQVQTQQQEKQQLEISEFRSINVQNTQANANANQNETSTQASTSTSTSTSTLKSSAGFSQLLSSHSDLKTLKNIGPSIQYKIRNAKQQAIEYHSYMLPIQIEGQPTFVIGMRESTTEAFKYAYVPAYNGTLDEWQALAQVFNTPDLQQQAIAKYTSQYPKLTQALNQTAQKTLMRFMQSQQLNQPGLLGLANMIQELGREKNAGKPETPETLAQNAQAGEMLMRIFHGMVWEMWQISRAERGLAPLASTEQNHLFIQRAITALSDVGLLKSPLWFQLKNFEQKQASVIQVTKSPGQFWVYVGCVMLIIGVFIMLYLQELRIWVYKDADLLVVAMARSRHIYAQTQTFNALKQALAAIKDNEAKMH